MKYWSLHFIFIVFFSVSLYAAEYWNGSIKNITTPELHKTLSEAIKAAGDGNYNAACYLLEIALTNKHAPEFNLSNENKEPLDLQLKASIAAYKSATTGGSRDIPEIEKISISAIKEYSEAAKNKNWHVYKNLYLRLVQYYIVKNDLKKAEVFLNKFLDYSAFELVDIEAYLRWGLQVDIPTAKAEEKINTFLKNGGLYGQDIILMRIRYKACDEENVFQDCIDFMREFPMMSIQKLNINVKLLVNSIDSTKNNELKMFDVVLNELIMNQPNGENRREFTNKLYEYKRKLEVIFPDVNKE